MSKAKTSSRGTEQVKLWQDKFVIEVVIPAELGVEMQNVVSVAVSVAVRGGTAEWSTHSREIQGEIGLHDADEIDVPQRRIRPQLSETVPMVGGVLDQRNGPHEIHQYVRLLDRQGQHPLATDHERSSDVDRCGVAVAIDVADVQPVEGDLAVVVDDELRIVQLAKIEGEVEIKVDIRIDMELTRAGQREPPLDRLSADRRCPEYFPSRSRGRSLH